VLREGREAWRRVHARWISCAQESAAAAQQPASGCKRPQGAPARKPRPWLRLAGHMHQEQRKEQRGRRRLQKVERAHNGSTRKGGSASVRESPIG